MSPQRYREPRASRFASRSVLLTSLRWSVLGSCAGAILAAEPRHEPTTAVPAQLAVHLDFDDLKGSTTANRVNDTPCIVRLGESAPGIVGQALQVRGKPDQAVKLGVLGFDQPATIALWIKRAASPAAEKSGIERPEYLQEHDRGQGRLLSRVTEGPVPRLAGALRVGPEKLEVWHGRGWSVLVAEAIPTETWVHLAITFDEQRQATGYLNGRRGATVSSGFDGREIPMALVAAAGERHYGFPFAGLVDDVRIYRGVLSEAEIARLAVPSARLVSP